MGRQDTSIATYLCDQCGKEERVESRGHAPWPSGWLGITGATPSEDMFCSWDCLGEHASHRGEGEKLAAQALVEERQKMAAAAEAAGGVT